MSPAKKPYFVFPDIPSYQELSFEKLSSQNLLQFCHMFNSDESPFTDERFKNYEKAKKYVQYIEEYGAYSTKHGGQDWLFLWNGAYAGVFHLYDLSLETFLEHNRRCWIGFAANPIMRKKGITKKALEYYIQYIFENYPFIKYIHSMTLKENIPALALLKSVGFAEDKEERMAKEYAFYVREKKG